MVNHVPVESRFFEERRRQDNYSYNENPEVTAGTRIYFPVTTYAHGRQISVNYGDNFNFLRRREIEVTLWSPNSCQDAYFPGEPPPRFPLEVLDLGPDDKYKCFERAYNGFALKFDAARHPQLYQADSPFQGYIYRERSESAAKLPEYIHLPFVWESTSATLGRLRPEFLSLLTQRNLDLDNAASVLVHQIPVVDAFPNYVQLRPLLPTPADLARLDTPHAFEDVAPYYAQLIRGLRSKDAWIRMGQEMIFFGPLDQDDLRVGGMRPANDEYLGVWVNQAPKTSSSGSVGRAPFLNSCITSPPKRLPTFEQLPTGPNSPTSIS